VSRQAVAGDLALTCANIFAQKARPILVDAGIDVVYRNCSTWLHVGLAG
jgi:hypothetical protein